jgi:diguanylate cyclase (GGDEF)-like protein
MDLFIIDFNGFVPISRSILATHKQVETDVPYIGSNFSWWNCRLPMSLRLFQLPKLIAERRSSAIFGVAIVLLLWAAIFAKYAEDVRDDLRDAQRTGHSFTLVFEENVLRSIDELDHLLFYLRRSIEARQGSTDYNTILHTTDFPQDIIVQVSIIDAHGIMRASTAGPQPAPSMDLSDREHFRAHLNTDEDKLFISKPLIGRVSGRWSIQLSRRFSNADGSFGGVVVASLDPEHFTKFYDRVDLGSSGTISMIGDDGVVRAAGGQSGGLTMGQDIRGSELFAQIQSGLNSGFELRDPVNGRIRLISIRKVKGQPLWVSVSLDKGEALAGSWLSFRIDSAAGLLLTLAILAAMELMLRTEAGARQKSEQLELTLESISQGIMLVTKDLEIPIINRRCGELLKLPDEVIDNPPRFDELADQRNSALHSIAAEIAKAASEPSDQSSGEPQASISECAMADGTVLEVRNGRLSDGGFVQTFTDITKRVNAEADIVRLASEDSLTGLLNRRGFRAALARIRDEETADPSEPAQIKYSILFLDLDRFKVINDTLSHRMGDLLLEEVAKRLRATLRSTDVLARFGGDEFAAIVRHVKSRSALADVANCLIRAIGEPCELGGYRILTSASIGIAVGPEDAADADDLVVAADLALNAAKERSRGGYQFYQSSMTKELNNRRQIELELGEAIERNELQLYYQPIVNLRRNVVTGFEALARWHHPTRGLVPPSDFIPVAEDTGLIVRLGEWALNEACRSVAKLSPDLKVAVNLSPVQFSAPDLVDVVQRALLQSGLAPNRLELEITERLLLDNNEHVISMLRRLRDLGVGIALDDFGTGYSALSYLRKFPLDRLKIDRSFVLGLAEGPEQVAIVQAVLSIANALSMKVTAEGVETADQRDFLKALGCDDAQGYLFSRPVPFEELSQILAGWRVRGVIAA